MYTGQEPPTSVLTKIIDWNRLPALQCRSDNVLRSVFSPFTAIIMKAVLRSTSN